MHNHSYVFGDEILKRQYGPPTEKKNEKKKGKRRNNEYSLTYTRHDDIIGSPCNRLVPRGRTTRTALGCAHIWSTCDDELETSM